MPSASTVLPMIATVEPRIRVAELTKSFRRPDGRVVSAVDRISLDIAPGEFLVLVGPSGCGKTTLLRCLAGLEQPDGGEVSFGGTVVYSETERVSLPPERRRAAMLFQSYALWPHMRVRDNVAFPLRMSGERFSKAEIDRLVTAALRRVHCEHIADSYPGEISGGQQQRVALARALVRGDSIIFFDEPLSNIDAQLREELRIELRSLQEEVGFSAIYVTHDQGEAMALADRIAVVREGRLAQIGAPGEIYDHPDSAYVARFMGAVNEFPGTVRLRDETSTTVTTAAGEIVVPRRWPGTVGDRVIVMARPSRTRLQSAPTGAALSVEVTIDRIVYLGAYPDTHVRFGDEMMRSWIQPPEDAAAGARVWMEVAGPHLMLAADDRAGAHAEEVAA